MPAERKPGRGFNMGASSFAAAIALFVAAAPVSAAPVANPIATFRGLDKISTEVTTFDVYLNETVQFGSLQVTPRACYTSPTDGPERTSAFVQIDQVSLQGKATRVFSGWMFADSPGLNAVDNPVYDVWLVGCKTSSDVPPPAPGDLNPPKSASR